MGPPSPRKAAMPATARLSDLTPYPSFERSEKLLGCCTWREMLTNLQASALQRRTGVRFLEARTPVGSVWLARGSRGLLLLVLLQAPGGNFWRPWGGASQSCSFPAPLAELGERQGKPPWCWEPNQTACGRFLFTQWQQVRGQWVSEMILPKSSFSALGDPGQEGKGLVPTLPVTKTDLASVTEGSGSEVLLRLLMVNIMLGLPTWTHAQTHPLCYVCVHAHVRLSVISL